MLLKDEQRFPNFFLTFAILFPLLLLLFMWYYATEYQLQIPFMWNPTWQQTLFDRFVNIFYFAPDDLHLHVSLHFKLLTQLHFT